MEKKSKKEVVVGMESFYDEGLERAVLSAIFYNPKVNLGLVSEHITARDFYKKEHGDIFNAMTMCVSSDFPIDNVFVKKMLGGKFNNTVFEDVIGATAIVDVEKYAFELKEKSIKRDIIEFSSKIPAMLNEELSSRELIDRISSDIYRLADNKGKGVVKTASDVLAELVGEYDQLVREKIDPHGAALRIYTGFGELDTKLGGMKNGDLVIIAARPGMGKTAFALSLALRVLNNGGGVVFFSLEMPATQLMFRALSSIANIPLQALINAELTDEQTTLMSRTAGELAQKPLWIYDGGGVSVAQVRTILRRLKVQNSEIRLCVIDYIGLMAGSSNFSDRQQQIAEISRGFKLLARELEMPIVVLAQLNRNLEARANKRPMMSDLRESGAIEQDADSILFVYRDDVYKEQAAKERAEQERAAKQNGQEPAKTAETNFVRNKAYEEAEIIIGKNRNGPTGTANLIYRPMFTRFEDKEVAMSNAPVAESTFQ